MERNEGGNETHVFVVGGSSEKDDNDKCGSGGFLRSRWNVEVVTKFRALRSSDVAEPVGWSSNRSLMAMRSIISSRSHSLLHFKHSSNSNLRLLRLFSDQGRVLDDEERARENLYVKKMEKEKLEKQKQKMEGKDKLDDKDKSEKKP
ncbi:unnamed protein product [Lactuca saligna]|uniref:Uncharacterized protein n=1 Tax=Lactuca saligna TaxID=75948 RepID=A0AA35YFT9_LACSI|nr:unnamed protein product [Lactuca saligna]